MKLFLLLCIMALLGCGGNGKHDPGQLKAQIISADTTMSRLAAAEGFHSSILAYADTNLVRLSEGHLPVIGKNAFAKSFDKSNDTKAISWVPVDAEVAKSGELGYTWGNWKFIGRDTVLYGNYFTIWKKQPDGTWKVALDGGNNTPKPGE